MFKRTAIKVSDKKLLIGHNRFYHLPSLFFAMMSMVILSACASSSLVSASPTSGGEMTEATTTLTETVSPTPIPEWFGIEMTDVLTGETFTINDYAGNVILLETMAVWCPNCIFQQHEVTKLHESLGYPDDFVSISLDTDLNEDEEILKAYVEEWGFDWHFAISPRQVTHDLGNLYSAQYVNPPLAPMMIIDRDGTIEHLPYSIKDVDTLLEFVEPYFKQ
jgi:cytochrome oxidase Cu insertion factor (SCO1/SenC/PrrC family)